MMNPCIYLAGPIDLAGLGKQGLVDWRKILVEAVRTCGTNIQFTFFNPAAPWMMPEASFQHEAARSEWIETVNNHAISTADAVVAYVPSSVMTVGTPIEIDLAHRLGKPVYILTTVPRGRSVYLNNRCDRDRYFHMESESDVMIATDCLAHLLYRDGTATERVIT